MLLANYFHIVLLAGPLELIEKLDRIMQDNEASLIAARADRWVQVQQIVFMLQEGSNYWYTPPPPSQAIAL